MKTDWLKAIQEVRIAEQFKPRKKGHLTTVEIAKQLKVSVSRAFILVKKLKQAKRVEVDTMTMINGRGQVRFVKTYKLK